MRLVSLYHEGDYHGASPAEITDPPAEQKASLVESLFATSARHTASQSLFEPP